MNWLEYAVLFLVAGSVTIALVPAVKRLAVRLDAIDYPSARRVNMLPIPRLGGVAILGGIIAALIVLGLGMTFLGWDNPFAPNDDITPNYVGVFIGILFMFGVGAVDDVVDLSPKVKMLGQIIAACIVAGSGLLLANIHNPIGEGYIEFGWVAYPLTVFYLVAFANIINLIDGLDGLAAGITAISAATILLFAVWTDRPDAAVFSVFILLLFLWAIQVLFCWAFRLASFHFLRWLVLLFLFLCWFLSWRQVFRFLILFSRLCDASANIVPSMWQTKDISIIV